MYSSLDKASQGISEGYVGRVLSLDLIHVEIGMGKLVKETAGEVQAEANSVHSLNHHIGHSRASKTFMW